jgi:transposase InsO family protein
MLNNLLLVNRALRILFLSETCPGSVHDQRIADTAPYPLPAGSQHRRLARRRVRIEHVHSRVKRCRMLQETIRAWKAGIRDMVMEIGGALHTFRVRLTPSWAPMV